MYCWKCKRNVSTTIGSNNSLGVCTFVCKECNAKLFTNQSYVSSLFITLREDNPFIMEDMNKYAKNIKIVFDSNAFAMFTAKLGALKEVSECIAGNVSVTDK